MIFLWIFLIGYVLSFRPLFRFWMQQVPYPNWGDVCLGIFLWMTTGIFWPILFVVACLNRTIGRCNPEEFARRVGGESREQKVERKRKELHSLQKRVEQLERELL